jgi:hypothetical protein
MKATIQAKNGLKTLNLSRCRAIREKCLNCSCWSVKEVRDCSFKDCPVYAYREGQGKQNPKARDKAIKAFCLWCMAGQKSEVKRCVSVHCALFSFRRGKAEKAIRLLKKTHGGAFLEANTLS